MKKKIQIENQVSEPVAAYGTLGTTSLIGLLGTDYTPSTDFDLLNLARKGVSKKALISLVKQISLTIQEVAGIMHISERTLQRYAPATIIKTEHAEKAIELARLYERGVEVFGTMDNFNDWMKTPNYTLNGETPFNLLDTSIGFDLILQTLGRIEYGIFS
ncbi:type II RES/Xre toxin-antitoxin system antitoxin [Pedobacter metabolipauper]|uniref:Putative toxin-antitoxin system antitoxin component (TIGR02293 family) n=1 Tax=Pedobacter metabolipauper TaxID=425513 RepID=A0A4R6ST61_9SPHI|nr:antitoxin Xre/MbcA/ParS toxin-binding domain-containing protein [Pedobacter metabolipauper]TDQ08605.1 putative toxin-antitoxin system antitoxin component (TIGR02293 family) [Pedobacter metabolipauper]